jgi:hypothetical protein
MELDAELGISLKAASKSLSAIEKSAKKKPYHIRRVTQAVAIAGTPTVLDLGSPPTGMLWNLLKLSVVGSDDRTTVAGATLASYIGDPSSPSVAMLLEPSINGSPVPNTSGYSDEVVWIHSADNLFVLVYGAAAAQSLTAIALIDEWIGEEA